MQERNGKRALPRRHGLHEVAATEWGRGGMGAPIVYSFRLSRHPLSISFCRKCSLSLTRKKNVGERCVMHGVEQQGRCVRKGSERSGVPIVFAALLELRLDRVLQLLGRAHGPRARGGSSSTAEAQKGQRARERRPSRTFHPRPSLLRKMFFRQVRVTGLKRPSERACQASLSDCSPHVTPQGQAPRLRLQQAGLASSLAHRFEIAVSRDACTTPAPPRAQT